MTRLTIEQLANRRARRAREATFPKCDCGSVLSLDRQGVGITWCPACDHKHEAELPGLDVESCKAACALGTATRNEQVTAARAWEEEKEYLSDTVAYLEDKITDLELKT